MTVTDKMVTFGGEECYKSSITVCKSVGTGMSLWVEACMQIVTGKVRYNEYYLFCIMVLCTTGREEDMLGEVVLSTPGREQDRLCEVCLATDYQ